MPYVAQDHHHNERTWWGDAEATVQYCQTNLPRICEAYGGDRRAVVLCGFSRGAIGVNYIGLHDDQIARALGRLRHARPLRRSCEWKGQPWGSPLAAYQAEARTRLKRLQGRRVLVCQNVARGTQPTRAFIGDQINEARFTFLDVPVQEIFPTIPNPWFVKSHTDRWLLRDSPYRRRSGSGWPRPYPRRSVLPARTAHRPGAHPTDRPCLTNSSGKGPHREHAAVWQRWLPSFTSCCCSAMPAVAAGPAETRGLAPVSSAVSCAPGHNRHPLAGR